MSITAKRVNNSLSHDRESTSFTMPQLVPFYTDSGGVVKAWAKILIPYSLNVEYQRESYEYIANSNGTPMTEAEAKSVELAVKAELTRNVTVKSVTQTDPTLAPTFTDTVTSQLCGEVIAQRNGTASNWTVIVKEYTPTYSITQLAPWC